VNAQFNSDDQRDVDEADHANTCAPDTASMQQAATSLISLARVGDESTVTVLREVAELIDHYSAVRQKITQRLSDDETLYKNMLRILLTPTSRRAEPLIELLGELIKQARAQANPSHDTGSRSGAQDSPAETDMSRIRQDAVPAFLLTLDNHISYAIDDQAFEQWATQFSADEAEFDLPTRDSEHPSRELDRLVTDAVEHGTLTGDPRLQLTIYEGDDEYESGYYIVLHNYHGNQRLVGITSGWTALYANDDATPAEQAREYLAQVCDAANRVLDFASDAPRPKEI
jgi:hypothetical protein